MSCPFSWIRGCNKMKNLACVCCYALPINLVRMSATDAIQASKFYLNVPTNSLHPYLEIIINWFNRLTRCVLSVLPVIGIKNSFKSWAFYLYVDTLGCESITRVWARKIASILFINCTFCYKFYRFWFKLVFKNIHTYMSKRDQFVPPCIKLEL